MSATQAPHPIALTAARKRLADALDVILHVTDIPQHKREDAEFLRGTLCCARDYARAASQELPALNAAAEILMPAEGAGLREVAQALLDACYADFGKPEPETDDSRDDGPVGGGATPADDMAITFAMMRDLEKALASPQPAVEGPVAAGVDWQPIETAPKDGTWFLGFPGEHRRCIPFRWSQRQFERFGNGWDFRGDGLYSPTHWMPLPAAPAATLTPPADPKPTVPGNDAGIREAAPAFADAIDPNQPWNMRKRHDEVAAGRDRSEQGSRNLDGLEASAGRDEPQEREGRGANGSVCEPVGCGEGLGPEHGDSGLRRDRGFRHDGMTPFAPQTGSAGEDPKTPDAGVGEALDTLRPIFKDKRRTGLTWNDADAERAFDLIEAALAQPAPVGEDETGVREEVERAWKDGAHWARAEANNPDAWLMLGATAEHYALSSPAPPTVQGRGAGRGG